MLAGERRDRRRHSGGCRPLIEFLAQIVQQHLSIGLVGSTVYGLQTNLTTEFLQYHAGHKGLRLGKFTLDRRTDVPFQRGGNAFQQLVGVHGLRQPRIETSLCE